MRRVRSSSELAIVESCGPSPSISAVLATLGRRVIPSMTERPGVHRVCGTRSAAGGPSIYRFGVLARVDVRGARDARALGAALPRPAAGGGEEALVESVRSILASVRERGDAAVREYAQRFDGVQLDELAVPDEHRKRALDAIAADVRDALETAAANVADFSRAEMAPPITYDRAGLRVRTLRRPVERAGCYVPGGLASYPSTVLMTAVPAKVAGVDEVVVCVPPDGEGRVADVVLAATAIAGVDVVYRIGGAQAIGAMAYGTESVPAVDV